MGSNCGCCCVALITLTTIVIYVIFTLLITEWRNKYRRDLNKKDNEANDKAGTVLFLWFEFAWTALTCASICTVDSLLNFETVKYFSNEQHELNRYDFAMRVQRPLYCCTCMHGKVAHDINAV